MTTILNFDTLVLSLYYHQYKFNDLNSTQRQQIYNAQAHCNNKKEKRREMRLNVKT